MSSVPALLLPLFLLLQCAIGSGMPNAGGGPASSQPVVLVAVDSLTIRARPDANDPRWAALAPGDSVEVTAVTRDGWLGFDPGVAQAGNSGSFRYRWIEPGGAYHVRGVLPALEVVWGPASGVAYAMTFNPVPIHPEPDSLSKVVDTLPGNSAAAIDSMVPGWYRVDPAQGPSSGTAPGWANADDVSISGDMPQETAPEGD